MRVLNSFKSEKFTDNIVMVFDKDFTNKGIEELRKCLERDDEHVL